MKVERVKKQKSENDLICLRLCYVYRKRWTAYKKKSACPVFRLNGRV